MAINGGRQVVIGGYMDPDGNIVEETKWVPDKVNSPEHIMSQINSILDGTKTPAQVRMEDNIYKDSTPTTTTAKTSSSSSNTFTPEETYNLRSSGYYSQGNTVLGDAWKQLADGIGKYSAEANSTLAGYNGLLNFIKENEAPIQHASGKLYEELAQGIQKDYDYANRMFGPDGELTNEVNKYYDDLGNYLASDAGRQAAIIAAQGIHTGASLGSIRAQQNEAYNQSFERYVKAKEQQINAKQAIASNLLNFMSTLRKEYGETTNTYIIEMYKRAADLYEKTAMSALSDINAYNQLKASGSGSGSGGGSSNSYSDYINKMMQANKDYADGKYKTLEEAYAAYGLLGGDDDEKDDKGTIVGSEADKDKKDKDDKGNSKGTSTATDSLGLTPPTKNKNTESKGVTAEDVGKGIGTALTITNPIFRTVQGTKYLTNKGADLLRSVFG